MYKDINNQEEQKPDPELFAEEIRQGNIIKKSKNENDKRIIFTFNDFKQYFEKHKNEQIGVDIRKKKGKENLMVYLNKYNIKFDSKSRFETQEDLDRFIEHFTQYKTYEDLMKEENKKQEENQEEIIN